MVSSAARVGSINVLLTTDLRGGVAGLNTFANAVDQAGVRTQRSVTGIDRSIAGMNRSMSGINSRGFNVLTLAALRAKDSIEQMRGVLLATSALFGGLIPAALGASMIRVADRAHLMSNDLRTVTKDSTDLKNVTEELFQVSQRSRAGFEATTKIYARTARATEYLGLSQEKLLRMTETIQKSFAVGGASTAEAWGAAIQLSQGIASNRFSGDEFRSVAENAPVLLQGMAKSMGVTIGKIREMAHAGKLTADVVVKAIIDASQGVDDAFAKTTSTIGQAMVQLDNAILKYVGDSEKVGVASNGIVTVINALSSNIDTVADSLVALGIAATAVMGGRAGNKFGGWISGLRAVRMEALKTAEEQLKASRAAVLPAVQNARGARQNVVTLARGRDDEMRGMRSDMLAANASKAVTAEQQMAAAAQKAGDIRAAADAKAAAAKANATQKWSQFMAVARQEKAEAVSAARSTLAAAEAQRVATQTRLTGAQAYYEMSKASGVSQKTQIKAGKDLQSALQANLRASNDVAAAQVGLQSALDGTAAKSRGYLAAQRALDAAKKQATATSAAAAAAEVKHTEAVAAHAAAQRTAQAAITSGNLTKEQEAALAQRAVVLEKKVAAAKVQSTIATLAAKDASSAAAAASVELAAAQRAVSISSAAMAAAGRAASAAWAFIGGPMGAALLAVGAIWYVMSARAAEAEERTNRYADAIARAKEETDGAAGSIRKVSAAMSDSGSSGAERTVRMAQTTRDLTVTLADLTEAYNSAGRGLMGLSTYMSDGYKQAGSLLSQFVDGKLTAEEFRAALDRIASTNPNFAPWIAEMMNLGDQADAERGRIDALNDSLLALQKSAFRAMEAAAGLKDGGVGEKGDKPEHILTNDEFNARFGGRYAKTNKELFPDLYKKPKAAKAPKKTADDRFDNDVQGIRDRIAAMQEEQSALGATYQEQQRRKIALDLEQTALKQVREEARKKGQQDWQNAQLSPEQTARINEVSEAYAQQAETLRQATEGFELRKDILSGGFTDLRNALEDGKVTSQEWADILINALDKVIDKIQGDLVDALAQLWQTKSGGTGGGGGGILGSIGGLLGIGGGGFSSWDYAMADLGVGLFDSGGTRLGSNIVPFGPKTKTIGNGVLADSGFGARHFPAILEEGEAVLTGDDMNRTMNVISAASSAIKDGGARAYADNRQYHIDARGAQQGVGKEIAQAIAQYDRQMPDRVKQINADPRAR